MRLKLAAALCLSLIAFACPAIAQPAAYGKIAQPWYQQGKIAGGISVNGTSSATILPTQGQEAWICNTGSADVYLGFGTSSAVSIAINTGSWLKAGTCWTYDLKPLGTLQTYVAAISATTSTLTVETGIGTGPYQLSSSGGGGGGGAITAASGSYASGAMSAGSYAAGAFSAGAAVDGWDLTQGTKADAVCATPASTTACSIVALMKAINNNVASAIPAGTNAIGSITNTAFGATLNTTPSLANGNGVVPTQGGSVLSATNGMYTNLLQSNAALSATNGVYANLLFGNVASDTNSGVKSAATQRMVLATDQPTMTNPQPVTSTGAANVTPNNCSGSITAGGTAQNAFSAQTTLHGFTIANIDTAHGDEVLWISFTTTAAALTAASYPLPAPTATTFAGLGSFTAPPGFGTNVALSVIGATTGHVFSCTWW